MQNSPEKLKIKFIMLMARALHRYGASADRIETALYVISEKLKVQADYFSLPTSIMASFKTELLIKLLMKKSHFMKEFKF